nr:coatomer subunit gamma [Quercus suber]
MHHSSLLWDAPLEGEEVPSVLTCCHRDKGLLEDVVVLDPRIATYIIDAGLDGLLRALSPGPLTIRWKGAKITTEHGMHILRAYCVSLALLRPNQCFFSSMVHVISRDQLCHHRSTDSCQSSQVDPTIGETEDDGVQDEYQLEDLEVVAADYMLIVGVSNFRNAWESMGDDCKLIMLFTNIMPSSIDGLKNFDTNDFYIFINLKLVVPTLKLFVANLQLLKWWSL